MLLLVFNEYSIYMYMFLFSKIKKKSSRTVLLRSVGLLHFQLFMMSFVHQVGGSSNQS